MKKLILTTLCFAALGLTAYAQGSTSIDVATEKLYMSSDASKSISALGSPYVNEDFLPVKVKGYDNQLFTGRYNAYNGEMEVNLGTKIIALDKTKDYHVMYTQNNKIYQTYNYSTPNGISKRGFLNVVEETPSYTLLKEEVVKYYEKQPAATSYQTDKPAKFIQEDDIFYLKTDKGIMNIPTRKKDLLRAYPKDAKKIKSFVKDNKISLNDENELKQLAAFLVTL